MLRVTSHEAIPATSPASDPAERAAHVFAPVGGWLFSEPMTQLFAAFGDRMPPAETPFELDAERVADWLPHNESLPTWLDLVLNEGLTSSHGLSVAQRNALRRALVVEQIAANHFNFRGDGGPQYRERSQAVSGSFGREQREKILALTGQLGLVKPRRPRHLSYDKTLILGGGHRSPLLRARYAAQLQAAGIALGELSFLGSPRFLIEEPAERAETDSYAPGATDEFDLMISGARTELSLIPTSTTYLCGCASADAPCPNWSCRGADHADQTPPAYTHERCVTLLDRDGRSFGSVLSASTGRPPYRPDTSDTFSLWARFAKPQPEERVLVITTQVFVPFQTFDALRHLYLQYGTEVDTVGYGAEWGDRLLTAEFLLQETLSAVRSARRLLTDAAEKLMRPCATRK